MSLLLSHCLFFLGGGTCRFSSNRSQESQESINSLSCLSCPFSLRPPPPPHHRPLLCSLQVPFLRITAECVQTGCYWGGRGLCASRFSWREPRTPDKLPVQLALRQWRISPHQCFHLFSTHSLNISVCVGGREKKKKTLTSHALWPGCNGNAINCTCCQ